MSHGLDEPMISLISAVAAVQSGNANALPAVLDLPPEALGAELGSAHHILPWSLETLINELLATPKAKGFGVGRARILDAERFQTLQVLHGILVKLENAEDRIFLDKHDAARLQDREPRAARPRARRSYQGLHGEVVLDHVILSQGRVGPVRKNPWPPMTTIDPFWGRERQAASPLSRLALNYLFGGRMQPLAQWRREVLPSIQQPHQPALRYVSAERAPLLDPRADCVQRCL